MQPVAKRYERYIYPVLFILLDYAAILAAEYGALGITDAIDPRQTLPYHDAAHARHHPERIP